MQQGQVKRGNRRGRRWHAGFACLLLVSACEHSAPFGSVGPFQAGPRTAGFPRRLTYSPLDDGAPSVAGGGILYSASPNDADWRARCLVALPLEGGQATWAACPSAPPDTFLHTWDQPVRSPDGARLAFLLTRSSRVGARGAYSHELVVAPSDDPAHPTARRALERTLPDGRLINTAVGLHWLDQGTIRFLAAMDSFPREVQPGARRFTDTIVLPMALLDWDIASGALSPVPGGDTVGSWSPAADGGFWYVAAGGAALMRVDAAGTATLVGGYSAPVRAITATGTGVVAGFADGRLEHMDAGGATRTIASPLAGPIRGLAWDPENDRLVVAGDAAPSAYGLPADLWLVQ